MKWFVAIAAATCAVQAQAAMVTVEYTATIDSMFRESISEGIAEDVPSSDWAGFTISVGETVTGRFTYDDTSARVDGWGDAWAKATGYTVTFNGSGTTFDYGTDAELLVSRGVSLFGSYVMGSRPYVGIFFNLPDGTIPAGSLPTANDWTLAAPDNSMSSAFQMAYNLTDLKGLYFSGHQVAFNVISAVPEPATYAMLSSGLVIAIVASRRRRKYEQN